MTSELATLLGPHRRRSLLLDANLLLVLAIGLVDPWHIRQHKKTTGEYLGEDYELLFEFISGFAPCLTTPHILTEVSNQLAQGSGALQYTLFQGFADLTRILIEHHVPGRDLVGQDQFHAFGLTDMGILDLAAREESLVVSADSSLVAFLMIFDSQNRQFRRTQGRRLLKALKLCVERPHSSHLPVLRVKTHQEGAPAPDAAEA